MAREMKDSGIEWIGEIPKNYSVYRLKHLLKRALNYGANSSGVEYSNHLPRYIRITDIAADGKLKNDGALSLELEDASPYILEEGDILFARSGATVGKSFIYHTEYGRAAFAGYLIRAQLKEKIVPEYVYYYTCSTGYDIWKNGIFIQSTIQNIGADRYANLPIVLPDTKDEQMRIVSFLEHICMELDNVLEKTRVSIEEYKKLKKAVITQAVTKGIRDGRKMRDSGIEWIGEIPLEWKTIKIKWILNERKEKSENGEEEPLSMSQKYGIIPTREMEMIPNMPSSFIGAKIVHSGDLVFNKLKAHLGVFAVSRYNGLVSPDYAVYYSQGIADVKYLEYLFKTPQYIAEFRKRSSGVGAGLTRLYTDELYSICCLLPSQDEQKEIICYLNQKINEIDTLIAKKEQYLSEIENYKKSLIYEYVTGKKEVPQEY